MVTQIKFVFCAKLHRRTFFFKVVLNFYFSGIRKVTSMIIVTSYKYDNSQAEFVRIYIILQVCVYNDSCFVW